MTLNQEIPRNRDIAATQITNNSVLAPSNFMTDSSHSPTMRPITPPAVSLKPWDEKCNVASAQLDINVAKKPPNRSE